MPIVLLWTEIKRLMEFHGISSRDDLSRKAGIERSNLYKIAKGNIQPSLRSLGKICKVLQCQPGDLLKFVPDQSQYDDESHQVPRDLPEKTTPEPVIYSFESFCRDLEEAIDTCKGNAATDSSIQGLIREYPEYAKQWRNQIHR